MFENVTQSKDHFKTSDQNWHRGEVTAQRSLSDLSRNIHKELEFNKPSILSTEEVRGHERLCAFTQGLVTEMQYLGPFWIDTPRVCGPAASCFLVLLEHTPPTRSGVGGSQQRLRSHTITCAQVWRGLFEEMDTGSKNGT